MDRTEMLARIKKLYAHFKDGDIPTLAEHEVHPDLPRGSRENYLYFTLPPCLNFQRSSPAMWKAALATWNDPETNYVFFPEQTAVTPREKLQTDLTKHKLALQKNRHTDIWQKISTTFADLYSNDPRELFVEHDHDASRILSILREQKKKDFPYLSGPKLSNYWLYILSQYTDVSLKNMSAISIIPDTHVLQSTVRLGIAQSPLSSLEAERLWKELLDGESIAPVQMHPVLWNWSRNDFSPEV